MLSSDGLRVIFWNRWDGVCAGTLDLPDGSKIQLASKTFTNSHYAFRLTFDPTTKKVVHFEGLLDFAEWSRLAGAPTLALVAGAMDLY